MKTLILFALLVQPYVYAQNTLKPLRVGIAGLSHGHVHGILRAANEGRIDIAGIAEEDRALAGRLLAQYKLPMTLLYTDLGDMLDKTKPEAVTAFGSIFDHLKVVKECAPRKISVMVEKPLAVNLDHATQMEALAKKYGIHLLTNYETTWYGSNHVAWQMLQDQKQFGNIVKMVIHDGHQGPKEIGVNKEFLEWLTDPILNGGGALMDFGCYGADLVTWLMKGVRPVAVSAVTQQIKPDIYPNVDDEATIIIIYPKAQAIIQASWNWPYSRKDMEVYGKSGYIFADRNGIRFMTNPGEGEQLKNIPTRGKPYDDPFNFLTAVVRGSITPDEHDLSSLAINMVAMEILDAATRSAREGKVIVLGKN